MKNDIKTELKEYTKPEVVVLDVKGTAAGGKNPVGFEVDFLGLGTTS